jgi:hypothetical protein
LNVVAFLEGFLLRVFPRLAIFEVVLLPVELPPDFCLSIFSANNVKDVLDPYKVEGKGCHACGTQHLTEEKHVWHVHFSRLGQG